MLTLSFLIWKEELDLLLADYGDFDATFFVDKVGLFSLPYLSALVVWAIEACSVCVIEVNISLGSFSSTKWLPLYSNLNLSAFGID